MESEQRPTPPVEDIEKYFLENSRIAVGAACCQGKRAYMQDVFSVVLSSKLDRETDFITVCDGHDIHGDRLARFVADELCEMALRELVTDDWANYKTTIEDAFLKIDQMMQNSKEFGNIEGGTTCASLWINKGSLYSAHVGDTRTFLSIDKEAFDVTGDHLPTKQKELNRIRAAGGFVRDERVNGVLAVSRAFGDFEFKTQPNVSARNQMVTALPDVRKIPGSRRLEFIVMCSDGVHNVLQHQEIVNIIHGKLAQAKRTDQIAWDILERVTYSEMISVTGLDNCTLLIVTPKVDFFKHISRPQ